MMKIGGDGFEEAGKYKSLGVMLASNGKSETEIKEKIVAVNRAIHRNKK